MKSKQINTSHLAFMGRIFAECLLKLQDKEKFASSPLDPEEETAPPNGSVYIFITNISIIKHTQV